LPCGDENDYVVLVFEVTADEAARAQYEKDMEALSFCRGCKDEETVAQDDTDAGSIMFVDGTEPNYPLNLRKPFDNKQCEYTCDPDLPVDDQLQACQSRFTPEKITCHHDDRGYVSNITFQDHNSKKVYSDPTRTPTPNDDNDNVLEIPAGERIKEVIV
jgi:hypothetical protein